MAHHNKFDYRIKQEGDSWIAEITRRITARKTSVSKREKGFETEALAEEWAKEQLIDYVAHQKESNKRKAEKRALRNELAAKAAAEHAAEVASFAKKQLEESEED
ncbi:DUF3622 domain-containing protein [Psychromonas sp. PT13]|uniref:DUF3622 domain-containing protein n=1 Tax=Psychromonas sp. PT13 TaxID=3439547 RepID=UPI003EB700F2